MDRAIEYAKLVRCPRLNCLAGVVPQDAPRARHFDTLVGNVKYAADRLKTAGIRLMIEPVNTRTVPGFFLTGSRQAIEVLDAAGSDNAWLQYDIFHMQIMDGDVCDTIKENHQYFDHYHTGGVPGRAEIDDTQELYYPRIIKAIMDTGFKGYVAQEFVPKRTDVMASLKQGIQICDV